jgi:hypothetical protein
LCHFHVFKLSEKSIQARIRPVRYWNAAGCTQLVLWSRYRFPPKRHTSFHLQKEECLELRVNILHWAK